MVFLLIIQLLVILIFVLVLVQFLLINIAVNNPIGTPIIKAPNVANIDAIIIGDIPNLSELGNQSVPIMKIYK